MPDTGASQSIVSVDIAKAANLCIWLTVTELRNASNGVMSLLREADVVMCNDKHSTQSIILVSSDLNHSALISCQDLQKLRVFPASFPAVAAVARCFQDLKTKTLLAFSSMFSNSLDNKPMWTQQMKIYLKDNCVPYRMSAPRPIPLCFKEPAALTILYYRIGVSGNSVGDSEMFILFSRALTFSCLHRPQTLRRNFSKRHARLSKSSLTGVSRTGD